jgi:hypothetical protein
MNVSLSAFALHAGYRRWLIMWQLVAGGLRGRLGASDAGVSVSPVCLRGRRCRESVDWRRYCRDISAGVYRVQDYFAILVPVSTECRTTSQY